jgi:aspartate kinase
MHTNKKCQEAYNSWNKKSILRYNNRVYLYHMFVFKFGGASVKDAASVKNACQIIRQYSGKQPLLIVISAMGKTTNALEELLQLYLAKSDYEKLQQYHLQIVKELFEDQADEVHKVIQNLFTELQSNLLASHQLPFDRAYDAVISYGELLSSTIVAQYLRKINIPSIWQDARTYIKTDDTWREGKIQWEPTTQLIQQRMFPLLNQLVVITQGFIGGTTDGWTTTLGREGSDFTAAIFGAALQAESVTIWKDVPGILNADPKRNAAAQLFSRLSYEEAAEMTYYGATVIHPKTIKPLANKGIPLYVRSFIEPNQPGTCISTTASDKNIPVVIFKPDQVLVSCSVKDFTFITEENVCSILHAFSSLNMKINLMQNTAISLSVGTNADHEKTEQLKLMLAEKFSVAIQENLELVSVLNYTESDVAQVSRGKKVIQEQKTLSSYQLLTES